MKRFYSKITFLKTGSNEKLKKPIFLTLSPPTEVQILLFYKKRTDKREAYLLFFGRSDSFAKCFALLTFPGSSTQRYAFGTRLTALR